MRHERNHGRRSPDTGSPTPRPRPARPTAKGPAPNDKQGEGPDHDGNNASDKTKIGTSPDDATAEHEKL